MATSKTEILKLRVLPAEKLQLHAWAQARDLTISEVVREKLWPHHREEPAVATGPVETRDEAKENRRKAEDLAKVLREDDNQLSEHNAKRLAARSLSGNRVGDQVHSAFNITENA